MFALVVLEIKMKLLKRYRWYIVSSFFVFAIIGSIIGYASGEFFGAPGYSW